MLTYEEITKSEAIKTYIIRADESLGALGYTEHSSRHFSFEYLLHSKPFLRAHLRYCAENHLAHA